MAFSANDLQFFYSGGAANTDPLASLGGIISSSRVASQQASAPVNVTGVSIVYASRNVQGSGTLSWSAASGMLTWNPPSSVYLYNLPISTDGVYVVGGDTGSLTVNVTYASLPTSYRQDDITIAQLFGNVMDAISPQDSLLGTIDHRCLYVVNTHASITATDVRVAITQQPNGPDELYIGLDPVGIGNGSTTGVAQELADEEDEPVGVTYSQPSTYASALQIGNLAPGECKAFWERRVLPAESVGNVNPNLSKLVAYCLV